MSVSAKRSTKLQEELLGRIQSTSLQGFKVLRQIHKLLERLHDVGTERDRAKNRKLHMDQYCVLILMWLFNPAITSMRSLQRAIDFHDVRKRFGVGRSSLGSLSESVTIFEPEALKQLVRELSDRLPHRTPVQFDAIDKRITAVDGSVFQVLSQISRLAWTAKGNGKHQCAYRLHTQFEVFRGVPNRIDITSANPKHGADERRVLERTIQADRCYLLDRGFEKYVLWNAIDAAQSQYVCRTRDNIVFESIQELPLSQEASSQGVISDHIVRFGGPQRREPQTHCTRLVMIRIGALDSRQRKATASAPSSDGVLRIATNIMDVPAEIIAALYQLRWTIELYFRIIKQLLGCRHLLSYKSNGFEIQMYMAIIACILILSLTGKRPSKGTFEALCMYLSGWIGIESLEEHIKNL